MQVNYKLYLFCKRAL